MSSQRAWVRASARCGLWAGVTRAIVLGILGCRGASRAADAGEPDASSCLKGLSLDCQVAFTPAYSMIFDTVLIKTCGSPGTGKSCHGPDGAQAGLVLSDRDMGYDLLLGRVDGRARVVPGNPECSILEQRLESRDPNFRMPLGNQPLPEGMRCAIRKWIKNGATKQ